jgi:hypothetical protein
LYLLLLLMCAWAHLMAGQPSPPTSPGGSTGFFSQITRWFSRFFLPPHQVGQHIFSPISPVWFFSRSYQVGRPIFSTALIRMVNRFFLPPHQVGQPIFFPTSAGNRFFLPPHRFGQLAFFSPSYQAGQPFNVSHLIKWYRT